MVESPDADVEFLTSLIALSTPQAKAELMVLESLAGHPFMPCDLMYYSEKLKQ